MKHIFSTLLPKHLSNIFPGLKISILGYAAVSVAFLVRSINFINLSDITTLLPSASPLAINFLNQLGIAQIITTLINVWGISQLLLVSVYFIVLLKYKAFIPIMYLFMFIDTVIRTQIVLNPNQTSNNPQDATLNTILIIVIPILFGLSFIHRVPKIKKSPSQS